MRWISGQPCPAIIQFYAGHPIGSVDNMINIVAVLERSNRVHQIYLTCVSSLDLEKGLVAMREPSPELTHLTLSSNEETTPAFPIRS